MLNFVCQDAYTLDDFVRLISFLRSENGCPWDRVQTHESIRRNFLEEAYEACEAIDEHDPVHMREELGDVLMQVLFHADIEREAGHFTIQDVADAACKKLVSRHPHVFGERVEKDPDAVLSDWEAIKRQERAQTTTAEAMQTVSRYLPALWRCEKVQSKAAKTGFDWPDAQVALSKVEEETQELRRAMEQQNADAVEEELGDLLFAVVKVARFQGIDPEAAAHRACEKFIRRFAGVEAEAAKNGQPMESLTLDEMTALYQCVKEQETHTG